MKKATLTILSFLAVCIVLFGCAPRNTLHNQSRMAATVEVADRPELPFELALTYYREGFYQKSAEYFEKAASLYHKDDNKDAERRCMVAAAKTYLRCSQRDHFVKCAYHLDKIIGHRQMPSGDECTLLNLAATMQGLPLPYPVKDGVWQEILIQ
ncbi:MAG: hypothetical protein AB1724_12955 [Thermodesulfobacteriota bacterium]